MAAGIMIPTKDKYDEAVEYLRENPRTIIKNWSSPKSKESLGGCLFAYADKTGQGIQGSGCLTMLRGRNKSNYKVPGRPDLTQEIQNDDRLPESADDITLSHLPVFAEWQRRLDKELQRD